MQYWNENSRDVSAETLKRVRSMDLSSETNRTLIRVREGLASAFPPAGKRFPVPVLKIRSASLSATRSKYDYHRHHHLPLSSAEFGFAIAHPAVDTVPTRGIRIF